MSEIHQPFVLQSPPSEDEGEFRSLPDIENRYTFGGCDQDNATLRRRLRVDQFLREIGDHECLADAGTRQWLRGIPRRMFREAIPLFKDDDSMEDYRLRPYPCSFGMGGAIEYHRTDVFGLSTSDQHANIHFGNSIGSRLVVPIGQLCVYFRHGRNESYWTGYDVVVDYDLSLWMIFRNHVDQNPDISTPKRQFRCKLTGNKTSPGFDFANFCVSLSDIETATLEEAINLIDGNSEVLSQGKIEFDHISTLEMDRILLRQELMNIVTMDQADNYKFWELTPRYTVDFIKENITKEVLECAAANEQCGLSMILCILRKFRPLREVIENSPSVIVAAAGNKVFGAAIVETLERAYLGVDEERRRLPISRSAIIKAATNWHQGLRILRFFLLSQSDDLFGQNGLRIYEQPSSGQQEEGQRLISEVFQCLDEQEQYDHPSHANYGSDTVDNELLLTDDY